MAPHGGGNLPRALLLTSRPISSSACNRKSWTRCGIGSRGVKTAGTTERSRASASANSAEPRPESASDCMYTEPWAVTVRQS